jgi:hypothetical protein
MLLALRTTASWLSFAKSVRHGAISLAAAASANRCNVPVRQGMFAALKPAEDLPLLFPGDQECYMSAAIERRIGQ